MKYGRLGLTALTVAAACLMFRQNAYGYLDPGTGSMVFQALAAVVVGGLAAVKIYWSRIRSLFSGGREHADHSPESDDPRA